MTDDLKHTGPLNYARCAVYSRFSTPIRHPARLEDKERSYRKLAFEKGWEVIDQFTFTDSAISGTSKAGKKGLDAMLAAAIKRPRPFDYLLVDDTSRLCRELARFPSPKTVW